MRIRNAVAWVFAGCLLPVAWAQTSIPAGQLYTSPNIYTVYGPSTIDAVSSAVVFSGATVTYQASTRITLGPGFIGQMGSHFHGLIGLGNPDPPGPPSAPGNLSGISTTTTVTLTWTPSTGNAGVISYRIDRSGGSTGSFVTSSTFYVDSPLTPGTSYHYTVTAIDTAGSASSSITVATSSGPPPNNSIDLQVHRPL